MAIVLLVLLTAPAEGQSQNERDKAMYDSSADAVVRRLQNSGSNPYWLGRMMRQIDKPQSSAKLDAVADSIVSGIIGASKGNSGSWPPAGPSLVTLTVAGRAVAGDGGTPYAGALDRLIRIHKEATGNVAILVLTFLPQVVGADSALRYLASVARSNDETAVHAMSVLLGAVLPSDYRPASTIEPALALLRQLFDENAVQRPDARRSLEFFAVSRGWKRSPVGSH